MVNFVQFQQMIREQLEQDKTVRSVDAEGLTVEAAVAEAAALLSVPVRRLEYEIVERGFPGFFGTGRKNWKIRAYERFDASKEKEEAVGSESGDIKNEEAVVEHRDGEAFVHFSVDGALLKVTAPKGKGKRVTEAQALRVLAGRHVMGIDDELVKAVVKRADGEYVPVGKFTHNAVDDSFLSVVILDQEMRASVRVNPPGPGGYDLSFETYMNILRSNHVVFGIDQEFLKMFADKPVYKENVQVAEGIRPVNGQDSYIKYNFDINHTKVHIREGADGRVDFKELNIIQNVLEGQPLAKKIPPEKGTKGRTVTGKYLPAKDGKDLPLPLGNNVRVADDGVTIEAGTNGQVVLVSDKISVEPVYVVPGNVDIKTGNVIFLGNVIVNGNVEDGFSVKAAGNIEVNGTVERAELDAEGDIIVHQGITGKSTGTIKAGRSLWARFIENATVEAGNMVVVSDGIINSQVNANKRIICQGKRAHIVGGRLRVTEEINAKIIGSPTSGTETICEVGFDPKSKEQMEMYLAQREPLEKELEEIQLDLQTLTALKKRQKVLPPDKEFYWQKLTDKRQDLTAELRQINEEVERLREFLNSQKSCGQISASANVYPGVRIVIRDAREDVRSEYKAVTFILENGLVRVTKYKEPDQDVTRGPDGYSAY
jgi:uncharacterized protein (DUF342 family)